jgi:hypothetical protein
MPISPGFHQAEEADVYRSPRLFRDPGDFATCDPNGAQSNFSESSKTEQTGF